MKQTTSIVTSLFLFLSGFLPAVANEIDQSGIVEELIEPYLIMMEGLASDDLAGAQMGARTFQNLLKIDAAGGPDSLSKPIKAIIATEDIATARSEFRKLTTPLAGLVENVGIGGSEMIYLLNCPMAFDNEGGEWLQSNRNEITNPYYGKDMHTCGSVVKQIAGKATDSVEE